MADDEIHFAYIKASEGGDLVDRRFAENLAAAGAAGLDPAAPTTSSRCVDREQIRHGTSSTLSLTVRPSYPSPSISNWAATAVPGLPPRRF